MVSLSRQSLLNQAFLFNTSFRFLRDVKHFLPWKHSGGWGCAKAAFFTKQGEEPHHLKQCEDVLEQ